jgi:hypothetical protein
MNSTERDSDSLMSSLKLSHGARGSLRLKLWRFQGSDRKVFQLHIRLHERNIYWRADPTELIELAKWILNASLIARRGYRG